MRPTVKSKWNSRAARVKQQQLRQSKLAMKTGFLTRKHGTSKQIGKKFPVKAGSKYGLEGAGRWLIKSAKIVGMGTARAERYLEKGAEKLGHIAATPKRLKQAYKNGYENPHGPVKQQVQTILSPQKHEYAQIEAGRFVSSDVGRRLQSFIDRLQRRLNTYGLTQSQRAQIAEKLSKAESLMNQWAAIEESIPMSGGLELSRLNMQKNEIKRELFAIGGKYWLKQAIKKKGALRDSVQRIYGQAGFTERGTIKESVLHELAKKKGKLGFRARLAIKLRSVKTGGKDRMSDRPIKKEYREEPPSAAARKIKGFRAKSAWLSKSRRGADVMAGMPSRKRRD